MQKELQQTDYLLGRKTFQIWENYWPEHGHFSPRINEGMKYVLSETVNTTDWKNTTFIENIDEIKKIKNTEGADLQVWGSSELIHLLLKNDLVDELRLKIYPLLLGNGKKLFDGCAFPSAFELKDSVVTSKGVVIANYKRGGEVKTGDVSV
ncbi:dihydrofolate reductase family protein [Flavobacterium sp. 3HN19-14]|uniref:dihydrofolate reductase family protein n=1 Tax=Flavobacterium sp. 3HN19-14 TaxID=3448133 RepID=UPI003EDEA6B8